MDLESGVRRFVISTTHWGQVKVLRPLPRDGDIWGVLGSLKGTVYEPLISVVPGDLFSEALYGRADPLMRVLGRPPFASMLLIPQPQRVCSQIKTCISANPVVCLPCKKLPPCYTPPGLRSAEESAAAALVTLTWAEGRYVVVVDGPEFTL